MARIPKTVFISYRRTNQAHAVKIYQLLQESGYDPFLDIKDLGAGAWRVLIQREIQKRAHFILLLTPSAVQRFAEPNDVMRFEIETALDNKRNLVPLMFDGFSYSDPRIYDYLTGKLSVLSEYNAYPINWRRLKKDIQELIDRFMSVHPDDVVHPDMTEAPKRDSSYSGGEILEDGIIAPEPNVNEESAIFGGLPDLLEDEETDLYEQAESVDKLLDDVLADKEKKQAELPSLPRQQPAAPIYPPQTSRSKSGGGAGGIILAILTSPAWLVYKLVQVIRDVINPPKTASEPAPMLDNKPMPAVPPAPVIPAPKPIVPPTETPPPPQSAPGSATGDFQLSRKRKPPVTESDEPEFERSEAGLGGMTEADLLLMMRQAMANMPPVSDEQLAMEEAEEFN